MRSTVRFMLVLAIAFAVAGSSALPVSAATLTPGKIVGVKATKITDRAISLSWVRSTRAKKYEVQYKVTGASKWTTKTAAGAKITVNGLKQKTKYSFRIRGINGVKKGKYSNVFTRKTYGMPAAVTGLKATLATEKAVSLSWNKASNATKYEVQYKAASDSSWTSRKYTATRATITGLKPNTGYSFKVRGLDGPVAGKFSATITQKTYIMPARVDGKTIYAVKRTKDGITIRWPAAKNANGYEIQTWQLNGELPADQQNSKYDYDEANDVYIAKPEFTTVIRMHPNTWYQFKVRSVNSKTGKFPALKSAWSTPFYACTTSGDRVITGKEVNGCLAYEMKEGPFVIGVDDALIPLGVYWRDDPSDPYYESDYMSVPAVTFPEDFNKGDDTNIDEDLRGKTYAVGGILDGCKIRSITLSPECGDQGATGRYNVSFDLGDHYGVTLTW